MKFELPRTLALSYVLPVAIVVVAIVGLVDFATGVEVRIFPLYFLPVALTAWYAKARWGTVIASVSGLAWMLSNLLAGRQYSSRVVWEINVFVQITAFALVGALISLLKSRLVLEEGLSRRDSLTALPNSRAFYETANILMAEARRYNNPITFAYLDLDNFKSVNDLYGHEQGDEVLRQVAAILREQTRASDVLARIGGDEFVLLLPNTNPDGAKVLLNRVCCTTAETMQMRKWPVTVSIGAVCFLRVPSTVEDGVKQTDSLMYRAKESGRNRVHFDVQQSSSNSSGY
jgi:diguanylate cyclase (GGDEF)-like protein